MTVVVHIVLAPNELPSLALNELERSFGLRVSDWARARRSKRAVGRMPAESVELLRVSGLVESVKLEWRS